jgi:hypothetical protein
MRDSLSASDVTAYAHVSRCPQDICMDAFHIILHNESKPKFSAQRDVVCAKKKKRKKEKKKKKKKYLSLCFGKLPLSFLTK